MTTVRDLLDAKGNETSYSVSATDNVLTTLEVMAEHNVSALLVTDGARIVGIFTERDYTRKGELEGRTARETLVRDVMTEDMYTVTTDTSIVQCMALMEKHSIRHLPVVEDGQLVGIVSIRDVMNAALEDRENEIKGLENYILGTGFNG